jgi:hypothetical protein
VIRQIVAFNFAHNPMTIRCFHEHSTMRVCNVEAVVILRNVRPAPRSNLPIHFESQRDAIDRLIAIARTVDHEPQQIHHNKPKSSFYYFIGKHGLVPDDKPALVHPVLTLKKHHGKCSMTRQASTICRTGTGPQASLLPSG